RGSLTTLAAAQFLAGQRSANRKRLRRCPPASAGAPPVVCGRRSRMKAEMPKIAGCLVLIFLLCAATARAQTCDYAGYSFSFGATLCECPNLRIVRSADSVGRGEITNRRLACTQGPDLGEHQYLVLGCLHFG